MINYKRLESGNVVPVNAVCLFCKDVSTAVKTKIKRLENDYLRDINVIRNASGAKYETALQTLRNAILDYQETTEALALER